MSAIILSGTKLANSITTQVTKDLSILQTSKQLTKKPKFIVIIIGNDPASEIYVQHKLQACKKANIIGQKIQLPINPQLTNQFVISLIIKLNQNKDVHGIILQLPIPKTLDCKKIISHICPYKDIDGLTIFNQGSLSLNLPCHVPCTALACYSLLNHYGYITIGTYVAVIGNSALVGSSLGRLLLHNGCTVTSITINSKDPELITKQADVVVVACGVNNLVKNSWVNSDCIVIDVGIHRDVEGNITGDSDFEDLRSYVKGISPVPGGVGPLTVAMLLRNIVQAYKKLECNIELPYPPLHSDNIRN